MAAFDLERFRDLAFGASKLPDHPLRETADVEKMLAGLPADPAGALAELTSWTKSIDDTVDFSPGRRARILLMLDDAARERWRVLGDDYLAPGGAPLARDGDLNILRAMFDSASEFTNGFGIVLDGAAEAKSDWLAKNLAKVYVRNMRWLARRLALAHMMRLAVSSAIWERMHRLYANAAAAGVERTQLPVFDGNRFTSSVRQEYVRALLLELAMPDSLTGRQVELAFRVTGRVAASVRLEEQASDGAPFAVVPAGDARPGPRANFGANTIPAPLYIDTALALPKLRAALERDMGREAKEPDTLFDGFTIGERMAMVKRVLDFWGMDPPRRRTKRVSMASPARVISGYENVVGVLPATNKDQAPERRDLQLKIDDTTQTLSRARVRAASRVGPARVIDASNGGLGIALKRADARWAQLGALVGVLIEPGKDWVVGAVRRIFSIDEELRIGVQVISTHAQVVTFSTDTNRREEVWADAMKYEATFKERYRKGIWLAAGDMLLEPRLASPGDQYDVPTGHGMRRIRITRVLADTDQFQRVLYEPLKT